MTDLPDPFEYLADAKLAFQRGNYNSAATLCRSALETCMKHRITEFDPNIDVNDYHDIPGIKALNVILKNEYSIHIFKEIKYMTERIGNLATHGSKKIPEEDAFYFIDRLNSLIKSILLSKGDKKIQVCWWDDDKCIKEYKHHWGNYISKQVDRKTIEDFNSSYIDLNVTYLQLYKPKEIESALTELRTYKVPLIPIIPFFDFPHQRNILNQVLDQQGIDKFERPYAEWKIRWDPGYELSRGVRENSKKGKAQGINDNIIKWITFIQNTQDRRSWILGEAGSGKSFLARKAWIFFIEALVNNESNLIPLFIDFSQKDTVKILLDILNTRFSDNFSLSRFIRILTQKTTFYELPIEDDNEKCSIIIMIDSVDELKELEVFYKLLELNSTKNIPFLVFSRLSGFNSLKPWIQPSHNILQVVPPDDAFFRTILSNEQLKLYSELPVSFRNQIRLPIFLKLFSDYSEYLQEFKEVQSHGQLLFFLVKMLIIRGLEKKLGRISDTHYKDSEILVIENIASIVGESVDSSIEIGNLANITISLYNTEINLRSVLISSGLIVNESFRHELFREIIYGYYILTSKSINLDKKYINVSILSLCRDIYLSNEIRDETIAFNNLRELFTFFIMRNPLIIAENYFQGCLGEEKDFELINRIVEFLLYRRVPRQDLTLFNIFQSTSDHPSIPIHPAIRVLSNKAFYERIKQHEDFKYVYENLIQSLKADFCSRQDFSGLKDLFLLKMLFEEHSIPKSNVIRICGNTKDVRAAVLLCEFLEQEISIYNLDNVKEALIDIGIGSESLLIDHITTTSNDNKRFVLFDVIAKFKTENVFNFLVESYKTEQNVYIKSIIIKGLINYSNSKINLMICEDFFDSSDIEKGILLTGFYQNPCKEFIESLTEERIIDLYNISDYYFTKTLNVNINDVNKKLVEFVIKDYNDIGTVGIYVLNFLIEYGKISPEKEKFVVEKLIEWGQENQKRLITYLQQLNGYHSNKAILKIVESEEANKNRSILFRLVELRKEVITPVFECLEETDNIEYAFELIRLIGLLGYSSYIDKFLQLEIINQEKLLEVSTWALIRMSSRRPEILASKLYDDPENASTIVLTACMLINEPKTKKALLYALDHITEIRKKVNIITSLLIFGEKSVIPKALFLLDQNIGDDQKSNLIYGLRFTKDENVTDFLERFLNEESSLFKQTLFSLTELKNLNAAKYWIENLDNDKINIDLKTFNWLTKTIPSRRLLINIEKFINPIKVNYITHRMRALNKEINIDAFLNICPEILEIPLINNDEKLSKIKDYLIKNEIINEGSIHERVRTKNLLRSTVYQNFDHYFSIFQDEFMNNNLISFSRIVSNIVHGKKEIFFEYIESSDSDILLLLVVLSCNYINTEESELFLDSLFRNESINPIIKKEANTVLLKYYSRNIPKLREIESQLKSDELLSTIRYMNPANSDCRSFCREILTKTDDTRLKFHSALKTGNPSIIAKTITEVFNELKGEYEIRESLRIIGEFGFGNLLDKVLNIYQTTQSQFLRNDCLNTIEKVTSPTITVKLLKYLKSGERLFTDSYTIKRIITKHLNKFVIEEIVNNRDYYKDMLEDRDILDLLIKSKDPNYWHKIVDFMTQIDIGESRYSLYSIDALMPFVDPEPLEILYQSEDNEDIKSFLIKSLILSGRRKYLEWWIDEMKNNSSEIPQIRLFGTFQYEYFHNFILTEKSLEIKKKMWERVWFERDISALSNLLKCLKSEKNPEIKETIMEKINNIIF